MAGLIRSLFKGKKSSRKESKEPDEDYSAFQSCPRQPTARFADDPKMLSATAAYHTVGAPRLRKGPQSCPGGPPREDIVRSRSLSRKASGRRGENFDIDNGGGASGLLERGRSQRIPHHHGSLRHGRSHYSLYDAPRQNSSDSDQENEKEIEIFERKSEYYMRKFEESERQRKEERRRQERLEQEKNSIQNAMSNLTYCTTVQQMATTQQMEQLKRERDQFKKELGRYKTKCEKLENKFEQQQTMSSTMSPSYGGFQAPFPHMAPSPMYQSTPQFAAPPPQQAPHSFNYPMPSNLRHLNSHLNPQMTSTMMMNPQQPPHHHRSMDFVNPHQKHPRGFENLQMTSTSSRIPGSFQNLQMTSTTSSRMPGGHFQNLLATSSGGTSGSHHSGSTSFAVSNTPSGASDGGAGEALVNPLDLSFLRSTSAGGKAVNFLSNDNFDDDEDDEIKNYRNPDAFSRHTPFSEITQSSVMTSKTNNTH